MKVEIFGNTLAAACAAIDFKNANHDVTWFLKPSNPRLRPIRLKNSHINFIQNLSRPFLAPMPSLQKTQAIGSVSTLSAEPMQNLWKQNQAQQDHWVSHSLFQEIEVLAQTAGVQVIKTELYPKYTGHSAELTLLDVPSEDLNLWEQKRISGPKSQLFTEHYVEILLPKNPRQQSSSAKIFELFGCYGVLEPTLSGGSFLGLFSPSKDRLVRTIKILRDQSKSYVTCPFELHILMLLNPTSRVVLQKKKEGREDIYAQGVFTIGQAVGTLPTECNRQELFGLDQFLEFRSYFKNYSNKKKVNIFELSRDWSARAQSLFVREEVLTKLWKKALLSGSNHRLLLSSYSLIPNFLRQAFRSPF